MLSEELKNKLIEKQLNHSENIGKLVGKLYRYMQIWNEEKNPYPGKITLTPSVLALLSNINATGSNNKLLSKCSITTKQATSRLISETNKAGFIHLEKNKDDGRVNDITLTDAGAELLLTIWGNNLLLRGLFEQHLGKEKTQILLTLLYELSVGLKIADEI